MKINKPKINKITTTRDIPFSFNRRLYHNFKNLLNTNERKFFYTNDYYRDIAQFCQDNKVGLTISEYLALNFFFLAQNKDKNGSQFLEKYLHHEKTINNVEFLNSHVSRAKIIIQALEVLQTNETTQPLSPLIQHSVDKLSDLLNIYYGYNSEEFEALAKAKIQDFYTKHEHMIEPEEAYMTAFLNFENHIEKNNNIFKTDRFQQLLEPFVKTNMEALIYHHKEETKVFKQFKKTLN